MSETTNQPQATRPPLPESLAGQSVLIVGGSSGIGAAAARLLARIGADVTVASRSGNLPEGLAGGGSGGEAGAARAASADVTDEDSLRALFDAQERLDHVLVTAATFAAGPVADTPYERVRGTFESWLKGAYLVAPFFLVVSDQDRSRGWYERVFGARVVRRRDPVILDLAGATLILNDGGGPTEDKPGVTLEAPPDPHRTSAFLNLRVSDVARVHRDTTARGARWLTEPIDRGPEIRGFVRDPDGHLIEVGQATGRPGGADAKADDGGG